ncbi:hypothetical protein [Nonomuraea typhae]|uniref:Uncharacterized protein n=1 Tax=Nonomuraea typhae TaxID=2603600 RepID=A0ABW7YLP4_9ACTN
MTSVSPRDAYADGLEAVAKLLKANTELEPPTGYHEDDPIRVNLRGSEHIPQAIKYARAMNEPPTLTYAGLHGVELLGQIGGCWLVVALHGLPTVLVSATTEAGVEFSVEQVHLPPELVETVDLGELAHHIYLAGAEVES